MSKITKDEQRSVKKTAKLTAILNPASAKPLSHGVRGSSRPAGGEYTYLHPPGLHSIQLHLVMFSLERSQFGGQIERKNET